MAKSKDTIIIIAGHGGTAFNKKDLLQAVSGYMKHYKNVKLIGNGEANLSLDKVKETLTDVKNGNLMYVYMLMGNNDRMVLIFVLAITIMFTVQNFLM